MSQMDNPQQAQESGGIREKTEQIRHAAQEQVEHLRQNAGEYYQQGREKAVEWGEELENYVREQPIKSVLIAAGVGMVLGFLWRRS